LTNEKGAQKPGAGGVEMHSATNVTVELSLVRGECTVTANRRSWALVAHTCNPIYSGGRDQEDRSSKPAWETVLETLS
jgi:hypothetical protein